MLGWGQASDGHNVAISHPEGNGSAAAMTNALRAAGLVPGAVDYVNAHATSTLIGDVSEARALRSVFQQDLARVASQRRLGDHDTRLRVDVGGYRERRRVALGKFALQMADEVKASGVARVLEPMSSADRKIIHDTLATVEGIATRSEGDDPYRRVVIAPGE